MRLSCLKGRLAGQQFTGNDLGCVLGRAASSDWVIDDELVSREHARIYRDGADYFVNDLGSQAGTRLNGLKLTRPYRLRPGDHLEIGLATVTLLADDAPVASGPGVPGQPPPPRLDINPLFWLLGFLILAGVVWLILPSPEMTDEPESLPGLGNAAPSMPRGHVSPPPAARPPPPSPPPAAPPSTEPPEPAAALPADYLFVTSVPAGATVNFDGAERGVTPLLLAKLPDGRHTIELDLVGYEAARRIFELPADGGLQAITLRQRAGTCLVQSEPSGAGVLHGTQLLGHTPLLLGQQLPPGRYELRLLLPWHEDQLVQAEINAGYATQARGMLAPLAATLRVRTRPAGAMILLNGQARGQSAGGNASEPLSAPLEFTGLPAETYELTLEHQGLRTPPRQVKLAARETIDVELTLWWPTVEIKVVSGARAPAMILARGERGDLRIMDRTGKIIELSAEQVESQQPLTPEQSRDLAERALRLAPPVPTPAPTPPTPGGSTPGGGRPTP